VSPAGARAPQQGVANAQKPGTDGKLAGPATSDGRARTSGQATWMEYVNGKLDKLSADAQKIQRDSK
jgi:hypothetical protein